MLSYFYKIFIKVRNIYKYQSKQIILVEKDDKIIRNTLLLWSIQLLSIFGLSFIINKFGLNYLYIMDDIYFYHTQKETKPKIIFSVINNCLIKNSWNNENITEKILKYNIDVPLRIIIENENIDENDNIEFEVLHLGQKKIKVYVIEEIKNKKLSEVI
jgi:hypothetical protein